MFPKLLDAKVAAGVFAEPQVKQMFACEAMKMKTTLLQKKKNLESIREQQQS